MAHPILRITFVLLLICSTACTDLKQWAYEGFNRDDWQFPDKVIQTLAIIPGDQVADLGAGSGYFTVRLADVVGPTGVVYAVDIDEDMNAVLAKRMKEKGYTNVDIILAKPHDPGLVEQSLDLIFSSNTYHHLEDRVHYFTGLQKYLKPRGRVAIIDFTGEGGLIHLSGHYTSSDVIQQELIEAGYKLEQQLDFLPKQNFLIFSIRNPDQIS